MDPEEVSIEYVKDEVRQPPADFLGKLVYLGPGIIIAGSIVGAGELIATTSTGAVAGFSLLWLILLGCIIKVFVQVELGKHAILTGKGTMQALSEMPGPRIKTVNWALLAWFIMFVAGIFSLGSVLAGIGQAMALVAPITALGQTENQFLDHKTQLLLQSQESLGQFLGPDAESPDLHALYTNQQEDWQSSLEHAWPEIQQTAPRMVVEELIWLRALEQLRQERSSSIPADKRTPEQNQMVRQLDRLAETIQSHQATLQAKDSEDRLDLSAVATAALEKLESGEKNLKAIDALIWAILIGVGSLILLLTGRFRALEIICLVLVGLFTLATIANLFLLQSTQWHIRADQLAQGLKFQLPKDTGLGSFSPLATALMTFGIIGVGAAELLAYPYWCLEKGYARYTGRPEKSAAWIQRAQGWLSILRMDAWLSMLVYTFSTVVFYLLGAAVLHSLRIAPASNSMVRSLAIMFEPSMGEVGKVMFLCGAVAVLYSTFLVATASHSKTAADALRVAGWIGNERSQVQKAYLLICTLVTIIVLVLVSMNLEPARIILIGGFFQAMMLPVLAATAVYFRYKRHTANDPLRSGWAWDTMLWLSSLGMFICGAWLIYIQITKL